MAIEMIDVFSRDVSSCRILAGDAMIGGSRAGTADGADESQ